MMFSYQLTQKPEPLGIRFESYSMIDTAFLLIVYKLKTITYSSTQIFKELIDLVLHKGNMKRDDHWIAERAPYLDIAICSQEDFSLACTTQRS